MKASAQGPTNPSSAALADRERQSYQRFLAAARGYWANDMFTALRRHVAVEVQIDDPAGAGRDEFQAQVKKHPTYQLFAWFERHLQRMRYSGPRGLVAGVEARREHLAAELAQPLPQGLLELDPDLDQPAYYTACDIHQHPGGVGADILAAYVYRDAVRGGVVGKSTLHERFTKQLTSRCRPSRVLDLGCGFGRSSHAFAVAFPDAFVHGIDLSASCVTVAAHETPEALRPRMKFTQADALASKLPANDFDLVTSTMLLHEMPEAVVHMLIAETGRLLVPGGMAAHLDFLPPSDPLLRLVYEGHAERNNEPYLLEHSRIDLASAYKAAGFRSVEIHDFAEDEHARADPPHSWRLPWKIILAVKEEA